MSSRKTIVLKDEAYLAFPEMTVEMKQLQAMLYNHGKPVGYQPSVVILKKGEQLMIK